MNPLTYLWHGRPLAWACGLVLVGALAGCSDPAPPVTSTTLEDDMLSSMPPSEVIRRQTQREELAAAAQKKSDDRITALRRQAFGAEQNYELANARLTQYAQAELQRAQQVGKTDEPGQIRASCLLWLQDVKRQPRPPVVDCRHGPESPTCGPHLEAQIAYYKAALQELERVEGELKRCPGELTRKINDETRRVKDLEAKWEREWAASAARAAAPGR